MVVSAQVCQTWLKGDWSIPAKLMTAVDVEGGLGDRLRLGEGRRHLEGGVQSCEALAERLGTEQASRIMRVLLAWSENVATYAGQGSMLR